MRFMHSRKCWIKLKWSCGLVAIKGTWSSGLHKASAFLRNQNLSLTYYTMCIRDLENLNMIWRLDFKHEPIFATTPATSKNTTHFNSCQMWPENNHFSSLAKVKYKSLMFDKNGEVPLDRPRARTQSRASEPTSRWSRPPRPCDDWKDPGEHFEVKNFNVSNKK